MLEYNRLFKTSMGFNLKQNGIFKSEYTNPLYAGRN